MENWKDTITNVTKSITKTSGELLKTTKISMELTNEEATLKNIYIEIGKKVHEIYAYGGSLGKVFDDKYKEIVVAEEKINELRMRLDMAKGTKTCPHCEKVCPKNSEFCLKCGKRIDTIPENGTVSGTFEEKKTLINEQEVSQPVPPAEKKKCMVCGEMNDITDKFCMGCGRAIL